MFVINQKPFPLAKIKDSLGILLPFESASEKIKENGFH